MNIEPRTPVASRITHGLHERGQVVLRNSNTKPSFGLLNLWSRFVFHRGIVYCKGINYRRGICCWGPLRVASNTKAAVYIELYIQHSSHVQSQSTFPSGRPHQTVTSRAATRNLSKPRAKFARWPHLPIPRVLPSRPRKHRRREGNSRRRRGHSVRPFQPP